MEEVTPIGSRKSDHIRINLEQDVKSGLTTGLEYYRFVHRALPEMDFEDVNTGVAFLGVKLSTPLLISSMTGGTEESTRINMTLATAAQETRVAMGVGSQRIALEYPHLAESFKVRQVAPDILLFANLGAVQLNYGYTINECQRAVDMIGANALVLHFNALQEALTPQGDTKFMGLAKKVETICKKLSVPVIAKEVGWGFSKQDIALLVQTGVAAIDTAGAGGTSWSQVEKHRAKNDAQRDLAGAFIDWGIPTSEVIENILQVAPEMQIIASGGLRNGVDIAKCIALGASLGGMAGPFLKAADQSVDATVDLINLIQREIRICMFATGSQAISQLDNSKLEKI